MSIILEFNNITKIYSSPGRDIRALENISFRLEEGEMLLIGGSSGSGKTTLLLIAACLLSPSSGQVSLNGQNPYALSMNQRNRLRANTFGFVFQQFHLIPYLSVYENIVSPFLANGSGKKYEDPDYLIRYFGLENRADHLPGELSTGEKQRTALARAFYSQPRIIMADEPTGNLDDDNAKLIYAYLQEYTRMGGSVLLVSHDQKALTYCSRKIELKEGKSNQFE